MRPLLRVGIDLTPAGIGITGIARYSRKLWEQLEPRTDISVRAFMSGRVKRMETANVLRTHVPVRVAHRLWHHLGWPSAEAMMGDIEVVHCLETVPPPTKRPLVLTWHDPMRFPDEGYNPRDLVYKRRRLELLDRVSVVLTTCQAATDDFVEATGFPRDRIVISPPGWDVVVRDAPPPVSGPFVLAAGAISPRKGLDVLAKAMAELGDSAPPLVIAGPDGYRADEVKEKIFSSLPEERCILLGEAYDYIGSLYSSATIVCHPSLAESFGMVCLEAMGSGAAVVAADIPSIREMGEGCISLVPAADTEALAAAIRSLLDDESERRRLGALARERAGRYTWSHTADQTVAAYRMAMGS